MKRKTVKIILSLFIILFCKIAYSQSGWFQLNPWTTDYLGGLFFLNSDTGFVVSFDYNIMKLHKTLDGGLNWSLIYSSYYMGGYDFTNLMTGYVCDYYSVKKTTNGGIDWFIITPDTSLYYTQISFANHEIGFVTARNSGFSRIYKTTNSGMSWNLSAEYSNAIYYHYFYNLQFTSLNTGYVLVDKYMSTPTYYIYKTTNNGVNWFTSCLLGGLNYGGLKFYNDTIGYLEYWEWQYNRDYILCTTNGSGAWQTVPTDPFIKINSIWFINLNTGYFSSDYGCVYKTTNGGINWINQINTGGAPLGSIIFVNDLTGYVCGENGVIKKTTTGGEPIGIKILSGEIPNSFSLHQNYPNPFNPTTKIRFDIPPLTSEAPLFHGVRGRTVRIAIFDLLGRDVSTLVNEQLKPGTYEVEWDGSNYSSGVYFYSLITSDYIATRKMVLLK